MRWILLDLALVLGSLGLLALVLLRLWRKVKVLGSAVARAGELVDQASASLVVPPRSSLPPEVPGRFPARSR